MRDVQPFTGGPAATNGYLYKGVLIDAPMGFANAVASEEVEKILLTHSHWDHTVDVAELAERLGAPVYCHSEDVGNVENPGSDGLPMLFPIRPYSPLETLADGDEIGPFKVIHTPGHTPGGVCFYDEEEGSLFSGDTLFAGSIGNLSFATAEPERMWTSLARLAKLPPETVVYPGHGEPTTIEKENWLPRAKEIFGG